MKFTDLVKVTDEYALCPQPYQDDKGNKSYMYSLGIVLKVLDKDIAVIMYDDGDVHYMDMQTGIIMTEIHIEADKPNISALMENIDKVLDGAISIVIALKIAKDEIESGIAKQHSKMVSVLGPLPPVYKFGPEQAEECEKLLQKLNS